MIYLIITMAQKESFDYAFTLTLCGRVRKAETREQYDVVTNWLRDYIRCCPGVSKFTLIAEITEHCDIHYHGIIRFKGIETVEATYSKKGCKYKVSPGSAHMYFNSMFKLGPQELERRGPRLAGKPTLREENPLSFIGFRDIKPIDLWQGWVDYLKKDLERFFKLTGKRPIIHDDYDLFTAEELLIYKY